MSLAVCQARLMSRSNWALCTSLEVDFFVRLNHNKTTALKQSLNRLTTASAKKRFQRNVRFDLWF